MSEMPDGLVALREVLSLKEIASLIERTARWVAPETFQLLPVWFPEHSRQGSLYKGNWSEPQMNKNQITGQSVRKAESNVYASKALTLALGLSSKSRTNWSCCHIWGVDDPNYQLSNAVVRDRRFFFVHRKYGFTSDASQGFYRYHAGCQSDVENLRA